MRTKKSVNLLSGNNKRLGFYILLMAWPVAQFCVFYIGVNFNSILLAFKEINPLDFSDYSWTTQNFKNWFADSSMFREMRQAFAVSLQSYAITLIVGVPLGLIFAYYIYKKLPGAVAFRVMLFLPSILSSIVLVSIFVGFTDYVVPELLKLLGVTQETTLLSKADTRYGAVMFYNVMVGFGSSVLMYSNKMASISPDVIESANLDGATGFREFWHIVLPMSFSTVSVFLVTGIAGIFTNQINAFAFFGTSVYPEVQTLGFLMYIRTYTAKQNIAEYPPIAALAVMLTVIAVPLTFAVRALLNKFGPSED